MSLEKLVEICEQIRKEWEIKYNDEKKELILTLIYLQTSIEKQVPKHQISLP